MELVCKEEKCRASSRSSSQSRSGSAGSTGGRRWAFMKAVRHKQKSQQTLHEQQKLQGLTPAGRTRQWRRFQTNGWARGNRE